MMKWAACLLAFMWAIIALHDWYVLGFCLEFKASLAVALLWWLVLENALGREVRR
jgi:hypothetical protein